MDSMKVTKVIIDNVVDKDGLSVKANGSVCLNDCLVIKFTIRDGKKGLFVAYKGQEKYVDKKTNETKFSNTVYFTKVEIGDAVSKEILKAYDKALAEKVD